MCPQLQAQGAYKGLKSFEYYFSMSHCSLPPDLMFSSSESNWMESFCKGVCLLKYQSITKVYQCCADIFNLNIFLDKLEMQEFVRSSAHRVIFIIAMTHEQYFNVFLMKEFVDDIYNHLPAQKFWLIQRHWLKKVRRELYAQCFDELIRQTTVSD